MTIASLLALCAFIAYLGIGIYAIRAHYKSVSSIIFFFFSFVLGLWSLSYFTLSFSVSGSNRLLWFCLAASGWTLLPAALLHFSFSCRDGARAGSPVYFISYIPACLFIFKGLTDKLAAPSGLVNEGFAWGAGPDRDPALFWLFILYFAAYIIASASLLFRSVDTARPGNNILYARLASLGILPVFAFAVAIDVFQPQMNLQIIPSISPIVLMPLFVLILNASSRPRPSVLSPLLAANDIIHRMNDLLILADNEGKIRHVNCRVLDLFGYEEDDLVGCHIGELIHDEEFVRKTFIKIRHKLFHNGEINLTGRMKDSRLIPLTVTGFSVSDSSGQVVGVALVGSKTVSGTHEMEHAVMACEGTGEDSSGSRGFNAADEKFRSLVEVTCWNLHRQ